MAMVRIVLANCSSRLTQHLLSNVHSLDNGLKLKPKKRIAQNHDKKSKCDEEDERSNRF